MMTMTIVKKKNRGLVDVVANDGNARSKEASLRLTEGMTD